jgi:hypothetical protein
MRKYTSDNHSSVVKKLTIIQNWERQGYKTIANKFVMPDRSNQEKKVGR